MTNHGALQPDGVLSINGPYLQSSTGLCAIDLYAPESDRVDVSGLATLGGTLDLNVLPGYTPALGDVFQVMTFAGHAGTFSHIVDMQAGPELVFAPLYSGVDLRLVVAIPGDFTLDGAVTGADYTIWADHFGLSSADWEDGDANGDGLVTGADFTIWADHFGTEAAAQVPEPASGLLVLAGALVLPGLRVGYRRRMGSP